MPDEIQIGLIRTRHTIGAARKTAGIDPNHALEKLDRRAKARGKDDFVHFQLCAVVKPHRGRCESVEAAAESIEAAPERARLVKRGQDQLGHPRGMLWSGRLPWSHPDGAPTLTSSASRSRPSIVDHPPGSPHGH